MRGEEGNDAFSMGAIFNTGGFAAGSRYREARRKGSRFVAVFTGHTNYMLITRTTINPTRNIGRCPSTVRDELDVQSEN